MKGDSKELWENNKSFTFEYPEKGKEILNRAENLIKLKI